MTQHPLQQDIEDDRRIMRRLLVVVGAFMLASASMAIAVTAIFG